MPKTNKKITFSGSIARRFLFVFLVFLVIPLTLHTFLLYRREILLQEADVRSTMKGLATLLSNQITHTLQADWKVLDAESPQLIKSFKIEKIAPPSDASDHFVFISKRRDSLLAGLKKSTTEAHAIAHPLPQLLALPNAPFPIDVSLAELNKTDLWTESVPLENTPLTLTLGTSSQRIADLQKSHLLFRLGSFLFLLFIVGGALVYWLIRKLNRPLTALKLTMERVADGALHSRFAPQPLGFEINTIGLEFNTTLDQLLENQKKTEQEKLAREKLAQELKLGRDIQRSLIPQVIEPQMGLRFEPSFASAKEVSGDFYDVHRLSQNRVLIAIGDVSGKGIEACLYSLGLRSSLRAFAEATHDLPHLCRKANELFLLDVKQSGFFATLWIGLYDGRHLTFASFGHPPALLKSKNKITPLQTKHPAFGVAPLRPIEPGTTLLEPGDSLLLYTDGITEAHNAQNQLFGAARLQAAFQSSPSILQEVVKFVGDAPQHDDIALLSIFVEK